MGEQTVRRFAGACHQEPEIARGAILARGRCRNRRLSKSVTIPLSIKTHWLRVFGFRCKWRRRSLTKLKERTHEEATEAIHAEGEGRHLPGTRCVAFGAHYFIQFGNRQVRRKCRATSGSRRRISHGVAYTSDRPFVACPS